MVPAIGPTQASLLGSELRRHDREIDERGFIISVAGVNTGDIIFSLLALYTINKPRSGALVAVRELVAIGSSEVLIMLLSCVVAGIVGYLTMNRLGRIICENIHKVNHKLVGYSIILFVAALTFYFDMLSGLMVLLCATSIGYISNRWKINKSHAMGCLIIPTMLYFM